MTNELKELVREIMTQLKEEGLPTEHYMILEDGSTGSENEKQIRSINKHFNHIDSDVLKGNWLLVYVVPDMMAARINLDESEIVLASEGRDKVTESLKEIVRSAAEGADKINSVSTRSFAAARDSLVVRLIPDSDLYFIEDEPIMRRISDFALVVYMELGSSPNEYYSAKLYRSLCRGWQMTDEEIFRAALENMAEKYPVQVIDASQISHSEELMIRRPIGEIKKECGFIHLCVMTDQEINGASAVFYPGVMKKLYELAGEPYYAVFTSAHEVHIHPCSVFSVQKLEDMLSRSNIQFASEKLTDTVFIYDPASDSLVPADR